MCFVKIYTDFYFTTSYSLKPNTNYQVRIRFNNDFGQSPWSVESSWIKTLEDIPSASPVLLEASPYESASIMLLWHPPLKEQWNSDVIRFRVLYRDYFSNSSEITEEVEANNEPDSEVHYFVRNLKRLDNILCLLFYFTLFYCIFLNFLSLWFVLHLASVSDIIWFKCRLSMILEVVHTLHLHSFMSAT